MRWHVCGFEELDARRLYRILELRQRVFVLEQACIYRDIDELDPQCRHVCGWRGGRPAAYARCLPPGLAYDEYPEASIGRVVVDPAARRRALGKELMRRAIAEVHKEWPGGGIRIEAQAYLEDFYAGFGFAGVGETYMDSGIPHRQMLLPA